MHIEEYIALFGKQHKNKDQNFEFHSISSLRKFIEDYEELNARKNKEEIVEAFNAGYRNGEAKTYCTGEGYYTRTTGKPTKTEG